jgi:hypothetical protein
MEVPEETIAGESPALTAQEMMMPFIICSCRNNNQPNATYPLGISTGDSMIKESTCDDATIMSLMVL